LRKQCPGKSSVIGAQRALKTHRGKPTGRLKRAGKGAGNAKSEGVPATRGGGKKKKVGHKEQRKATAGV